MVRRLLRLRLGRRHEHSEWSGIQSGDDIDSGDTDVGGSLAGLLARERQLSAAGSRARWRVLTKGYQGRLAHLRFIEVDHAPAEIRMRLRRLGHLAALIDQTRPWRGLAGMPPHPAGYPSVGGRK